MGVAFVTPANADLVFLFARTRAELNKRMPRAVATLDPASSLWVFFRKGSGGAGLDMNRDTVWAVAETLKMRPLGLVTVNETWSAFRLKRAAVQGRLGRAQPTARHGLRGHRESP